MSKTIKSLPFVTVLMSVHNSEKVVDRAVKSILDQSYTNFEFLIINDASTDNTPDILKSYHDKRVRIINNEKNLGLTRSLNLGLEEARGKYIARIDADDISCLDRLKKQVNFLEDNPDFILLGTNFNIVDSKNRVVKEVRFNTNPEKLYYDLVFQNMIAHSSTIYKLSETLKIGGYDENYRYAQDYDLWLRLSNTGKIWVLPETLTSWCDDLENISSKRAEEQNLAARNIFKNNLKKIGIKGSKIGDLLYLHNFYDREFTNIPSDKIYSVFMVLQTLNGKIISKAPNFYNKNILLDIAYQNIVDLLTRVFKETRNKSRVFIFLLRNLFNLKLTIKMLKKFIDFLKKRVIEGKR